MDMLLETLLPALLGILILRALIRPLKGILKLCLHGAIGFLCLWSLNLTEALTGLALPVNGLTVLTAGSLGLPGIAMLVLLEVLT